jgi:serine/threonine protein kinase
VSEDCGIRELGGRYRVITPLGRRVMRGWDLHLRQVVAIRLVATQDGSGKFAALTNLSHPGLVRVLDAGVADDEAFVVQEFVAGTTLRARLAEGPLTRAEVTGLGSALAGALAHAHSRGVVHRDVSPGNIMLGPGMEPLLTNIGVATTATPSYMSPEEADGKARGPASDVYSLGLVLLEALTGRVEYPGDDATTAFARLSRAPKVDRDLPHAATLSAMLSREPHDRPKAAACADMLSGSSAKARVQTRTVLIAAVAAAIAATGIGLVLNMPDPLPTVEQPRHTRIEVPLRDWLLGGWPG